MDKQQQECEECDCIENPHSREEMKSILSMLDIKKYDPDVVDGMIKFSRTYIDLLLDEAKWLRDSAKRTEIDSETIDLAAYFVEKHSVRSASTRKRLLETAKRVNKGDTVDFHVETRSAKLS